MPMNESKQKNGKEEGTATTDSTYNPLASLNTMELIDLISSFSVLVTVGMHCTGIITCRKYISEGSVGSMSHLPFLSAALTGALWTSYGLLVSDNTVILVNVIGTVLQSLYFICYYLYSEDLNVLRRDGIVAVLLFLSTIFYFFYLSSDNTTNTTDQLEHVINESNKRNSSQAFGLGVVCNIFTVLFFASPLSKMSEVIRSSDSSSMSLPLSIMSTLVTLSWFFYGILVSDIFILMPNMIGFVLCVAQLALFIIYPSSKKPSIPL